MIILKTKAALEQLKKHVGNKKIRITQEGEGVYLITGSRKFIAIFLKHLKEEGIEFQVEERGYTDEAII